MIPIEPDTSLFCIFSQMMPSSQDSWNNAHNSDNLFMKIVTSLSISESYAGTKTGAGLRRAPSAICRSIEDPTLASSSCPKADTREPKLTTINLMSSMRKLKKNHLFLVSVLQKRVKHINLLQLPLLIKRHGGRYSRLGLICNNIILWRRGGWFELGVYTSLYDFLERDLGAKEIDRPLA